MVERGPFDKFLSPWHKFEGTDNVEDRRNEDWPWADLKKFGPQTKTVEEEINSFVGGLPPEIPPATRLGLDAGIHSIEKPSEKEIKDFLSSIAAMNPTEPTKTTQIIEYENEVKRIKQKKKR